MGDMITLPLDEILSQLPFDLEAQVLARPGVAFSISASAAVEQLRTGAVRIPFAQLRQGSPPGTFADNATQDDALIDLPLPLILAAIGTAGLARRPDQKLVSVPDEVTGVFGAKLLQFTRAAERASAPAAAPIPAPMAPKPAVSVVPKPVAPIAMIPVAPVVPFPAAPKPTTSISAKPAAPKTPASAPIPFAVPKPSTTLPFAAARAAAPLPTGDSVCVTIEAVSETWPDPVRQQIEQLKLDHSTISIPVNRLEPCMKTGRVAFTWAELCGWLPPPSPPPAHGESQVELPLRVIAPLFLAKHRAATPRKIVHVAGNVPELFSGPLRQSAPTPAPAPVVAPPVAAPVAAPNVLGEILGQPSKTDWTPQEITQRILSLQGVAGALLASNDGLLVAGQAPAPLKAETMAAFLPRIFTHTGLCTGEIQLGALRALKLSVGPAICMICKAGTLYLAVLGQPGQTLPEAAVEQLAVELARQKH
jgi:predicted regulator of Ras-like GTPase activity (Roadblock/LC7/MglB family)